MVRFLWPTEAAGAAVRQDGTVPMADRGGGRRRAPGWYVSYGRPRRRRQDGTLSKSERAGGRGRAPGWYGSYGRPRRRAQPCARMVRFLWPTEAAGAGVRQDGTFPMADRGGGARMGRFPN